MFHRVMLDWIFPLYFPHSKEVAGNPLVPQLQEVVELVGMGMEEEDMDILESVELQPQHCQQLQVFKMDIKPKEPLVFRGTAAEDVDTWLAES